MKGKVRGREKGTWPAQPCMVLLKYSAVAMVVEQSCALVKVNVEQSVLLLPAASWAFTEYLVMALGTSGVSKVNVPSAALMVLASAPAGKPLPPQVGVDPALSW